MALAIQLALSPIPSILGVRAGQALVTVHHWTSSLVNTLDSSRLTVSHVYLVFQRRLVEQPQRITGISCGWSRQRACRHLMQVQRQPVRTGFLALS